MRLCALSTPVLFLLLAGILVPLVSDVGVCRAAEGVPLSEAEMAERIDQRLRDAWRDEGITPADRTTDAEFLRRAWLDLCGIIPPINDDDGISGIRSFLNSEDADKRERLIEALLANPKHATHFANRWKRVMLPDDDSNIRRLGGDVGFQNWLRGEFADNTPYDEIVSKLLLATGTGNQTGPALFYTALELKPEELAASSSRIFLGTQIQCAQCHDHPFDHWTRKDFWGYAAFFARLQRPNGRQTIAAPVIDAAEGEVEIPDSDEVLPATFLGGEISADVGSQNRRQRLAAWLTSAENPYFARATVNRVWGLLFGRGIVDPVDDLGQHNEPSHPELLDDLADYFVQTDFDLNRLIRTLTRTGAYQLSSRSDGTAVDPELFARMAIKSLTAEQLYDCLIEGMRRRESSAQGLATFGGNRGIDQGRQAFLAKFRAPTQGATDYEAGIPQALSLMNGTSVRRATDLANSDLLRAIEAPFFSNAKRVEVLFLSTLSRMPSEDEQQKFVQYVEAGGSDGDSRRALSDVLWALLNSGEFILNH